MQPGDLRDIDAWLKRLPDDGVPDIEATAWSVHVR
jgi:hypothetical protein